MCNLNMHLCLADTKDGGWSVWLDSVNGAKLAKYATDDLQEKFEAITGKEGEGKESNLKASCRCGGVQFEITRPMEQSSKSIHSGYPGVLRFLTLK